MKNNKLIVTSIISTIFLSACGSSMYERPYWKSTNQKSDWDIDSLYCEEKARVAKTNASKLADDKATTDMLQSLNQQQASYGGKNLSGVFGLLGGVSQSAIHSQAKSDEFINCMKDKHWSVKK